MTLVIVGGVFVTAFFLMFLFIASFFQRLTKKTWQELFPGVLYSSGVLLFSLAIFLFGLLAGTLHLPMIIFQIVFNIVYFFSFEISLFFKNSLTQNP